MKKDKKTYILLALTIAMLIIFGYVFYTKISSANGKYVKETELKEVSLEDEDVLRAVNSLSFNYRHDLTQLEKKLFSNTKYNIKDLNNNEKMLLLINDIGYKHKLPTICSNEKLIINIKSLKDNIVNSTVFLKDYSGKGDYKIGPYTINYNGSSLTITNGYCSNPLEYSKIVPIKATKSNKRLILQIKYLYIEEAQVNDQTTTIAYKNYNKDEIVDDNYSSSSSLDNFNTYEVTFNISNKNINFYEISLLK